MEKKEKRWPFYGASILIHALLVCLLSLLPQGLGHSPFQKAGPGGVYRVRFLGGGQVPSPSLPSSADTVPGASSEKASVKAERGKGIRTPRPPRPPRAVESASGHRKARRVPGSTPGKMARVQTRKAEARGAGPGDQEARPVPRVGSLAPAVLVEPGYGEGVLLASMALGPGVEARGSGGEGRGETGGLVPPLPLVREKPPYPPLARRMGYQGRLIVRLLVSPLGRVDRVDLVKSSGYSILDRAAVRTLRKWRFRPAIRGGHPVSYWVEVPVVFSLREGQG